MAARREDIDAPIEPEPFGRYLLVERVAQGRLASVHRALLRSDGEPDLPLAIKRFAPELSQDRRFAERATRVLERAAQIEHPAHCGVAEVASAGGTLYAALEWVSGKDLKRIVVTMRERGETMPAALVAYLGSQVAEVLAAAHALTRAGKRAPLLHGELSPADILIGHDGRVCLTGLGSAELAVAAHVPAVRPVFHAPEIGRGAACSEQSDVFSLGACLYQVLSLRLRDASSANARADSYITQIIPPALKQIVNRALAEDPTQRWPGAAELAHELQRWGSAQTQPGDARGMAAFMRELFGVARDEEEEHVPPRLAAPESSRVARQPQREGGWDGAEHTPPHGELMQQLAADMVEPATPKHPEAPSPGAQAIVDAIVNPDPALDAQSWSDDPWEEETPVNPWISSAEERAASEKPRPRAVNQSSASLPAPSPRDRPAPRVHSQPQPQPQPSPVAPVSARNAVPAAPFSPPVLESWHTERRSPWLMLSLAAMAALGLLLGGLFMLRSPAPQPSRATAPEPVPVVEHGAANAAPAVAEPEAHAHEPEPMQKASAPSNTVVAIQRASNRSSADARRARGSASRDDRRDDGPARPEPAEVSDDLEPAAASVESEPQAAAPPALPSPYIAPEQSPARAVPVTVAPRSLPTPAPAASSPSVSRGPTRAATLITRVAPGFPARAKRRGIDAGVVTVEYTIDSSGSVKDAVVVKADPPGLFDEAVLDAIRQWKYQPKLVNGAPVDSREQFTFRFE